METVSYLSVQFALLVFIPIVTLLTRVGFLNSFTAPLATLSVSKLLNFGVFESILFVLSCWMAAFTIQGLLEVMGGISLDLNLLNLTPYKGAVPRDNSQSIGLIITRTLLVILFMYLPIGKPPLFLGPLVGIVGFAGIAFNNAQGMRRDGLSKAITYTIIQTVLMNIAISAYLWIGKGSSFIVPIVVIIAISMPELVGGSNHATLPDDEGNDLVADPLRSFAAVVMSWVTPGYSLSTSCAMLLPDSVSRLKTASLLNGVVEGWVIHITLIDAMGGSGKSTIGDILRGPMLLGNQPLQGEELTLLPINLLIAAGFAVLVLTYIVNTPYLNNLLEGINVKFITLASHIVLLIALANVWALGFLAASLICYLISESFQTPSDLKTLAPLAIIS